MYGASAANNMGMGNQMFSPNKVLVASPSAQGGGFNMGQDIMAQGGPQGYSRQGSNAQLMYQ